MADNRTLLLTVKADVEVAREQLKNLVGVVGDTGTEVDAKVAKMEASFGKIGSSLSTGAALLAGVAGGVIGGALEELGSSFIDAGKRALEFAGTIGDAAEKAGTSTKFLQEFRFAAIQTGTDIETADKVLEQFNTTIGNAAGGNRVSVQSFKALGVSILDTAGNVRPLEDVYKDAANAIAKLPDPAQQAAFSIRLFGAEGNTLLPILRQGAAGFDEFAKAAAKLGIVLSPEQIANAQAATDKFAAMKSVLDAEFASAITANAGAILSFADGLFKAAAGAAEFAAQDPDRIRNIGLALAGAALGGTVAGLPGAATLGTVGYLKEDALNAGRGARKVFDRDGFFAAGSTSFPDLIKEGRYDDPDQVEKRRAQDQRSISALPNRTKAERNARLNAESDYGHTYGTLFEATAAKPTGNAPPINLRAAQVIEDLQTRAAGSGSARDAAINAALVSAGVERSSVDGKKIVALAGSNYDRGPGARAAIADGNRATAATAAAESLKLQQAKRTEAGNSDVDRAARALRTAEANATGTPEARYASETANVDDNLADRRKQITAEGPGGTKKYNALQATNLAALAEATAVQQHIALDKREEERQLAEKLDLQLGDIANAEDIQRTNLAMAETAGERRTIELKLLDLQLQEARAREEIVLASKISTEAEKTLARGRLAAIDATEPSRRDQIMRSTAGPLEQYRDAVDQTSGKLQENLQGVAVDGIQSLEDGIVGVITQTRSLGDAFTSVATSIIADLARIAIQKFITGQLITGATSLFGGGFAEGGIPPPGKISLVGEDGPELLVGNGVARVVPIPRASPRGMAPGSGGGGTHIYQTFDNRGSIMTEQLYADIQRTGQAAAEQGALGGARITSHNVGRAARRAIS